MSWQKRLSSDKFDRNSRSHQRPALGGTDLIDRLNLNCTPIAMNVALLRRVRSVGKGFMECELTQAYLIKKASR